MIRFHGAGLGSAADRSKRQKLEAFQEAKEQRTLITLDDNTKNAVSRLAQQAADGQVDPLDAFMAAMAGTTSNTHSNKVEDEEEDPLDRYMKQLAQPAPTPSHNSNSVNQPSTVALTGAPRGSRFDSDEEYDKGAHTVDSDDEDIDVAALLGIRAEDDEEQEDEQSRVPVSLDEDDDGPRQTNILLPPLDHSRIVYPPFRRHFYTPDPSLLQLPDAEMAALVEDYDVSTTPPNVCRLCYTFALMQLDSKLLEAVSKHGYTQPTAIQAQTIPLVLMGRDVIGLAKTGSGKTAAFVLAMIVHIKEQPNLTTTTTSDTSITTGAGPIAVVVAPTRELAEQIYIETRRFAKLYHLITVPIIGGMQRYQQQKVLQSGCHIIIATPGRLLELLQMKACTLHRVTYLVLDECDRLLSMGFEPQIRAIVGQIRPDKQMLLFSATMPRRVETLCRDLLHNPVTVRIGTTGAANQHVIQQIILVHNADEKLHWLLTHLSTLLQSGGRVLMFVSTRLDCQHVEKKVSQLLSGYTIGVLHGDKHQYQRMEILHSFKQGKTHLLIATDVAARGLDVRGLATVINWDVARNKDAHVHRIGRTGRAGATGQAITFLQYGKDESKAGWIVESMEQAGQDVEDPIRQFAMRDKRWSSNKQKKNGIQDGQSKTGSVTPSLSFRPAQFPSKSSPLMNSAAVSSQSAQQSRAPQPPPPTVQSLPTNNLGNVHPSRLKMLGIVPAQQPSATAAVAPAAATRLVLSGPNNEPAALPRVHNSRWDT